MLALSLGGVVIVGLFMLNPPTHTHTHCVTSVNDAFVVFESDSYFLKKEHYF